MDPTTRLQLALFLGALLGTAMKAWATNSQATISKRSILDVIIGALSGLLVPSYFPKLVPQGEGVLVAGAAMALVAYASSDFVQNVLGKINVKVDAKPLVGNGGPKEPPPPAVTEAEIGKVPPQPAPRTDGRYERQSDGQFVFIPTLPAPLATSPAGKWVLVDGKPIWAPKV